MLFRKPEKRNKPNFWDVSEEGYKGGCNGKTDFADGNGFFLRKGTGFPQKIPQKNPFSSVNPQNPFYHCIPNFLQKKLGFRSEKPPQAEVLRAQKKFFCALFGFSIGILYFVTIPYTIFFIIFNIFITLPKAAISVSMTVIEITLFEIKSFKFSNEKNLIQSCCVATDILNVTRANAYTCAACGC
jgi:hypothetical protein